MSMTSPQPWWRRWWRWSQWRRDWQDFDGLLLFLVIVLTGIGVTAIYSTRHGTGFWLQHLLMALVSGVIMLAIARVKYEFWLQWHWVTYAVTLAALVAVMFFGVSGGGAERWIPVAGFQVQPSEFAKIGVILTLAALLHHWPIKYFSQIWLVVMAIAPPWLLIFLQPNLGTALVFIAICLGMLYWGGAPSSWILLIISPGISAVLFGVATNTELQGLIWAWIGWTLLMSALAAWQLPWQRVGALTFGVLNLMAGQLGQVAWSFLKPYQRQRLLIFMDPGQDPLGAGYHLIQSRIGIGAGGVFGRGLLQGTQTQLEFIPEQHTDFIFAAVGEEMGFIGAAIVIMCFWLVCLRLLIIAQNAKDSFGSLIVIGVFSMILFQSLVNIGMTIGLAPITGLPLPFMSYGRSALLTNFIALGLVESVAKYRQRTSFFY